MSWGKFVNPDVGTDLSTKRQHAPHFGAPCIGILPHDLKPKATFVPLGKGDYLGVYDELKEDPCRRRRGVPLEKRDKCINI